MSHFSVAVFSHNQWDVDKLLAPFEEGTNDPRYLEWEPDEDGGFDEEKGECGYYRNPNGKWDWYEMGGRFSDALKLKYGCSGYRGEKSWTNDDKPREYGRCDQAQVKDVDFSIDLAAYRNAMRFWEVVVEGLPLKDGEKETDFLTVYKPHYYTSRYESKEDYAATMCKFGVRAFVTPDGEWREQGEMGWFGLANDTKESIRAHQEALEKFIAENPDLYITIVDCHI